MGKSILIYSWGSVCEKMVINAFRELGYKVTIFKKKIKDYHVDAEFAREYIELIHKKKQDIIFSYN